MFGFLDRAAGPLLSVLRLVSGLLFLEHGTMKLLHFPPSDHPAMPLTPVILTAGLLELIGGALLSAGLFTRLVAFVLSGEMAVAYFMAHAPQGNVLSPLMNQGESAVLFCFIFLLLSVTGAGTWSVDKTRP